MVHWRKGRKDARRLRRWKQVDDHLWTLLELLTEAAKSNTGLTHYQLVTYALGNGMLTSSEISDYLFRVRYATPYNDVHHQFRCASPISPFFFEVIMNAAQNSPVGSAQVLCCLPSPVSAPAQVQDVPKRRGGFNVKGPTSSGARSRRLSMTPRPSAASEKWSFTRRRGS